MLSKTNRAEEFFFVGFCNLILINGVEATRSILLSKKRNNASYVNAFELFETRFEFLFSFFSYRRRHLDETA